MSFWNSTSGSWASELGESQKKSREMRSDYASKVAEQAEKSEGFGYGYEQMASTVSAPAWGGAGSSANADTDVFAAPTASLFTTNAQTGGTQLSDLYGKAPEPEQGLSFGGMASNLFASLGEATSYGPTTPAAATGGFGFGAAIAEKAESRRTDMYCNVIQSDGLNDYVEMNGTRYNIDFGGNYRACDMAGNEIQAQNASFGGGTGGLYGNTSGVADAFSSTYGSAGSTTDMGAFYGAPSTGVADAFSSTYGSVGNPNDIGSFYGTSSTGVADAFSSTYGSVSSSTDMGAFYGAPSTGVADAFSSTYGSVGNPNDMGSFYGNASPAGSIYSMGTTQETSNIWGTTNTANTGWGGGGGQADTSAVYGSTFTATETAAANTSWWGGGETAARAAEREQQTGFYSTQSAYWGDDNKNNNGWG